ncbi:hypothetical protein N7494_001696 [Penicillium frequentans]|uniref:Uncharacterized protein n=1 Tax=Penicillium frequentans TaxID=3151616 RepID=A0AAD6D292_9EURO|nr:hypothetical protein N7494_001696 [Penicillium glabrum]
MDFPAVLLRWDDAESSSPSPNPTKHLSVAGKAGIGIGVTMGVLLGFLIGFSLFYFKRRRTHVAARDQEPSQEHQLLHYGHSGSIQKNAHSPSAHHHHWSSVLLDSWFYESIAVCFSIASFIAIFCTLLVYNQQKTPKLPSGLTLNTVVSILATCSKSSLLYIVGECIGQLRWISFGRYSKPLSDVQAYDSASRGPWGSLIMLLKDKGYSLASLGALVTVLGLLFDPFVQQILTYPVREVTQNSSAASIQQSRYIIPDPTLGSGMSTGFFDAANAGIWTDNFDLEPKCPSGDCTWPLFQSVELCTKCQDVTSSAKIQGCQTSSFNMSSRQDQTISCNISLPQLSPYEGSISLSYETMQGIKPVTEMVIPEKVVWVGHSLPLVQTLSNKTIGGVENPLLVIAQAEFSLPASEMVESPGKQFFPGTNLGLSNVTECVLSLCSRTYNVSVSSGQSSIRVEKEDFGNFYFKPLNGTTCWKPSSSPYMNSTSEYALVDYSYRVDTDNFAFCGAHASVYQDALPFPGEKAWTFSDTIPYWILETTENITSSEIKKVFESGLETTLSNIAAAVSKYARDMSGIIVSGQVTTSESYVSVHWPWLILPALLLLLGVVLLVSTGTLNRCRKTSLWKSSVLPLIYHGLEKDSFDGENGYESMSKMESSASETRVKLGLPDTENRLMLIEDERGPGISIMGSSVGNLDAKSTAHAVIERQRMTRRYSSVW